jgi:hypothetical protein
MDDMIKATLMTPMVRSGFEKNVLAKKIKKQAQSLVLGCRGTWIIEWANGRCIKINTTDLSEVGRDPTLFKRSPFKMLQEYILKLGTFVFPPGKAREGIQDMKYPSICSISKTLI